MFPWPSNTAAAVNRWIVPRAVMCSLFWTGVLLVFTGMILLVTSKHKGAMFLSWGSVLLGLGSCFLLVCFILCLHAYHVTSILNREEPGAANFVETVDPPYNAPSVSSATSGLANGRKPRSIGTLVAPPKYGVNIQQPPVRRIVPPPSYLTDKESQPVVVSTAPPIVRWFAADSVDYQDVKPPKPLSPITEASTPPTVPTDTPNIPQNDSGSGKVVAPVFFHRKSLTDRTFQEASDVILNSLTPAASNLMPNYVTPTSPTGKSDSRISSVNAKTASVKFDTGKYPPFYSDNSNSSRTVNCSAQIKSARKDSTEYYSSNIEKSTGRAGHARLSIDSDGLSAMGFSSATLPRDSHFRPQNANTMPIDKLAKSTSERDDLSRDDGNSSRPESNFTSVETVVAAGSLARLRSLVQEPQRQVPHRSPQMISSNSRKSDNIKTSYSIQDTSHADCPKISVPLPHSELRRPLQRQNRVPDVSTDFRDDGGESQHPQSSFVISTPAEVHNLATADSQRKTVPDHTTTRPTTMDNIRSYPPSTQHSLSRSVTRTFGAASVTVTPLEKHSDGAADTWRRTAGHHRSNESSDDAFEGTMNRQTLRTDSTSLSYDARGTATNDDGHSYGTMHHEEVSAAKGRTMRPRRGGGAFIPVDRETVLWDREPIRGREDEDAAQKRFDRQHRRPSEVGFDEGSLIHSHRTDSLLSGDIDSAMMLDERTRMCGGGDNAENLSNIVNAFEDTTSKATVYDNVQYFRM